MAERMTDERLAEIRDLQVDSIAGSAPYNPDVWTLDAARRELVAEVNGARAREHALSEEVDGLRVEVTRLREELAERLVAEVLADTDAEWGAL